MASTTTTSYARLVRKSARLARILRPAFHATPRKPARSLTSSTTGATQSVLTATSQTPHSNARSVTITVKLAMSLQRTVPNAIQTAQCLTSQPASVFLAAMLDG